MVESASPVILATATLPPRPAVRTSPAAKRRRPRSSSFEPTACHRSRIALMSIMPTGMLPQHAPGNPAIPSHNATPRCDANRFSYFGRRPKGPAKRSRNFLAHDAPNCQQNSDQSLFGGGRRIGWQGVGFRRRVSVVDGGLANAFPDFPIVAKILCIKRPIQLVLTPPFIASASSIAL